MLRLIFAGGLHHDPDAPIRMREFLHRLANSGIGPPAFVATEWDSAVMEKVEAERASFIDNWVKQRTKDTDPKTETEVARALAATIAWEADASIELFPKVPIVWLEDGRKPTPPSANLSGKGRSYMFSTWLPPPWTEFPIYEVLEQIKSRSRAEAEALMKRLHKDGKRPDVDRDYKWKEAIEHSLQSATSDWALAIVGAAHASAWDEETLFSLLSKNMKCEVEFLVFEPVRPTPD